MPRGRPKVERITVPCTACGREVEMRPSDYARRTTGRVFCSADCRKSVGTKPRSIPDRTCEVCGTVFHPLQRSAVARFCSKACHDEAQRQSRVERTCAYCGEVFTRKPSATTWTAAKFCSRVCMGLGNIRRPLPRQHNGKPARLDPDGYVLVWEPEHPNAIHRGWIYEHRLVGERVAGRPLTAEDEVHHVNRIRHDNRPENLEVLDGETHRVISTGQRLSDRQLLATYIARYGPLDP